MNPYIVLNVSLEADDAAIRRSYLEGIKKWPPEHHPKQFQVLTAAYEKIKDAPARTNFELFDKTPPADSPLDLVCQWVRDRRVTKPLPIEAMKTYLRSCSKK